ncbi:hypothetical protein [Streptomyces sp. rh34]|uniref:hypothetical protein n=1 Tax=Streptomyces sp. rh34 TaxID=2034272 RepID=UPI001180E653|nr:hypothetical protein [Streptomyces sp. rh34]
MSAGGRLSTLARTRITYTGEPYQFALETLKGTHDLPPLPDVTGEQALLESQVMANLSDGGTWSAHPVGISGVRLSWDNPIMVHLDSHVELSRGENYPVAWHAGDRLLPYVGGGGEVGGVAGLRIAAIRGNDLHLTLASADSRLILRGITGTRWSDYLDERRRDLAVGHAAPLWDSPELTDFEWQDKQSYPRTRGAEEDVAPLGSGLLRRVALFHTSNSAYSSRSWTTGSDWIFELDTRRDVRLDHDTLLGKLPAPVWGLPLRVVEHHCTCDDPPLTSDRYMRQCTYELVHDDVPGCALQFRFRWGPAVYGKDARRQLERLGSDLGWLNRVLPRNILGSARGVIA